MTSRGVIREWRATEGWGVIDSDDTPGGCWAHFSVLRVPGFRSAERGQSVTFDFEHGWQDGFDYRATRVELDGIDPVEPEPNETDASTLRGWLIMGDGSDPPAM